LIKKAAGKFSQFIFNRYKKNEAALHELNYLFWECTRRCNLRCIHCGSDCSADSETPDLPFEDFLKAALPLREKYKNVHITVAITGGEPLLRKDLAQCGRILREHGFGWGIVTNGYDYSPYIHGRLLAAGMGSLTLSLDGLESSHNWLRSNNQSFERAVKALELITTASHINYDVVTCVNQRNIHELEEIKKLLISLNVRAWRLFTITPIGRAAQYEELFLQPGQLRQLMDFIVTARNENRIKVNFCCEAFTGDYELKVRDNYFFCRAGIQVASVMIDGSISACPNINRCFIQGNIYHDNFLDVWDNKFLVMRDRSWTKTGMCLDCREYKNCNGGALHQWNEKKDEIMTCVYQRLHN
jgi:radical SAM enzyme (rSAM/lipoprotein system)